MPSTERFTLAIAVRWKAYECVAVCQPWVSSERSATMDGYMEQMWMHRADVTKERPWRSKSRVRLYPVPEGGSRDNTANLQSFQLQWLRSSELQVCVCACGSSCPALLAAPADAICKGKGPHGLPQCGAPRVLLCIPCRCCHNFVVVQFDIRLPAASERGTLSQLMFHSKRGTDSIHGTKDYYHSRGDWNKNYDYVCFLLQNLPSGSFFFLLFFFFLVTMFPFSSSFCFDFYLKFYGSVPSRVLLSCMLIGLCIFY